MLGAKGHNEMHPPGGLTEKRGDVCGVSGQEIAHAALHILSEDGNIWISVSLSNVTTIYKKVSI